MRWRSRALPAPVRAAPVAAGEKALAGCMAESGAVVVGTRDAFYISSDDGLVRIPWEQVEKADWDNDSGVLSVVEVGTWGAARPVHELTLAEPGRLLELVRERVTASVVLQRHVPIRGRRGVKVIARRAPGGDRALTWVYEFDEGVDPDDPEVRRLADLGLAKALEETGLR
ncbi:MAG TPA: hypothetical protein VIR30_07520 [Nocardioides sp.]